MIKLRSISVLIGLIYGLANISCAQPDERTRVIVTTDGEFDDRCSMVRFLLYSNEFEVEGLIHSSSKFHWKGRGDDPGMKWHDVSWLDEHLEAYEKIYPNLLLHSPDFPKAESLRDKVFVGNIELAGDMDEATPGSDRIVEVLLDSDPSPVWLQAWGGANTVARALKTIQENYPEKMGFVSEKARLFLIMEQDSTYRKYIKPNWPELTVMISTAFPSIGYPWKKSIPEELYKYYEADYVNEMISENHGPLCEIYRRHLQGGGRSGYLVSEGDSPSFMQELNTGLRGEESPTFGDWGGRFEWNKDVWVSAEDDGDKYKTIYRWIPAFQNDFAARADWCIKPYNEANHAPNVSVSAENITAKPGGKITISAQESSDPDGNEINFNWWQYADADTYEGLIEIAEPTDAKIKLRVPKDAKDGDTIHIICEVTDNGSPVLTRYKRIIITVKP